MKICFLGRYYPNVGGVATHIQLLKTQLEKLGHTTAVIGYAQCCQRGVYHASIAKFPVVRGFSYVVGGWCRAMLLSQTWADLLHAHYLFPPGLTAVLTKKNTGKPVVITIHGSDILNTTKPIRSINKYVLLFPDHIITVSNYLKETLLEKYAVSEKKVTTIRNGVDTKKLRPPTKKEKEKAKKALLASGLTVVLYLGSLTSWKGLKHLLLSIAKTDSKQRSKMILYIVGNGPEKKNLERYAHKLGISNKVVFAGETQNPLQYLIAADIVVLPSIREGLGISLLEAMCLGVPVIATKVGGIPEIVKHGETGLLVPPGDVEALRDAVSLLVDDKSLGEQMGERGHSHVVKHFSLDQMVEKTLKVYQWVLSSWQGPNS